MFFADALVCRLHSRCIEIFRISTPVKGQTYKSRLIYLKEMQSGPTSSASTAIATGPSLGRFTRPRTRRASHPLAHTPCRLPPALVFKNNPVCLLRFPTKTDCLLLNGKMVFGPGLVRLQYRGTPHLPVGESRLNDSPLSPQDDMLKQMAEVTD